MVRIKHRYLTAQILSSDILPTRISSHDILAMLREKIQELYGDVGSGNFGRNINLRYYGMEYNMHVFVIRCPRDFEQDLRFTMACCNTLSCKTEKSKLNCLLRLIEISGSSRSCKDKLTKLYIDIIKIFNFSNAEHDNSAANNEILRIQILVSNADI